MPPTTTPTTQSAPPLLLCEALGFSPQLLLDDIINVANNAVQDGVNGMEEFLQKWADERVARGGSSNIDMETTTHEVEQGLVAFQTLLEHHTDIAFDFFEAWCLRNIFMIPNDLPVVLPHQEGLDLTVTPEQEQELMDEIDELRKRLDGVRPNHIAYYLPERDLQQRKLKRMLLRANLTSSRQLKQAQTRLSYLSSLSGPDGSTLETLHELPPRFVEMYNTLSSLPPLDTPASVETTEAGKRPWETSKTGYMNWALGRLLTKGADEGEGAGHLAVDKLDKAASMVGTSEELRRALDSVEVLKHRLDHAPGRDDDSAMDESP
ncbi:hypothetical protein NLJ89_g6577 [Agrocybe chaxingu]|uniref:Mis12 domain-containing protein n=1 Tax=Agrocybe chaxingu TaxID=84603 RepID=A0A9W8MVV9_9AGAR|nr:hypothetical protein NLJ89_g6577 [Agrocybe chaxingu]